MTAPIVVKVGTNVITKPDGLLNQKILKQVVAQISARKRAGDHVIVVSSGSIAAGRALLKPHTTEAVATNQILSAVGQPSLMESYNQMFRKEGFLCAQVLTTKEDFRSREHYLNMKRCFDALLADNVVPIVNENDVTAIQELMFTDNDELAGLVSTMVNASQLIILTNVDGVLTGHPDDSSSAVIPRIEPGQRDWKRYMHARTSQFGRGGMQTKCEMAVKLASTGIPVWIINGTKPHELEKLLNGQNVGTKFPASFKKASSVKRWIAHATGTEKGSVQVNSCTVEILHSDKVVSLLPIGVVSVAGDFIKGDVIRIQDDKGQDLGLGKAQYDAAKAREYMGQKGKRALVHYDYLYVYG